MAVASHCKMVEKRPYPQCLVSVVLNLAAMLEHADEALVPAVYAEMGQAFGVGPTALGALTLVRAVLQALAFPLCAYLATRYNRAWVIGTGCLVWGVATALVGVSTSYWQVFAPLVNPSEIAACWLLQAGSSIASPVC